MVVFDVEEVQRRVVHHEELQGADAAAQAVFAHDGRRHQVPAQGLADHVGGVLALVQGAGGKIVQRRLAVARLVDGVTFAGLRVRHLEEENVIRTGGQHPLLLHLGLAEDVQDVRQVGLPAAGWHAADVAARDVGTSLKGTSRL